MNRYALVKNNTVAQIVEQDSTPTIEGDWHDITSINAGVGYTFDGQTYTPPVVVVQRYITNLAFMNRFTDAEAIAIDLASIGATVQAAGMRRYMQKVNAARFIDLDRPETRAGVQALEGLGLLAPGRALEILDNPVQPEEVATA